MEIKNIDLTCKTIACPICSTNGKKHSVANRFLYDLGFGRAVKLNVKFNKYFCEKCCKYFSFPMTELAGQKTKFTNRVKTTSVCLIVREGLKYRNAVQYMKKEYFVDVPLSNIGDWVGAWKKKRGYS